jgi:hypothetical protein
LSTELLAILIAILAVVVTSLVEVTMLYRMYTKMSADDAALYLQGRRIQEVVERMRQDEGKVR